MVNRISNILKSNSFFLFGARGTGKTTLLRELFDDESTLWLDLLDPELEDLFLRQPKELIHRIEARPDTEWVVIDEIQKVPKLLNLVHQWIEKPPQKSASPKKPLQFALTGSSARRLKQRGVNLLAGRAFTNYLFPLTFLELGDLFNLGHTLQWGALPKLLSFKSDLEKAEYLRSYVANYISWEIQLEQWVRKVEPFRKFLPIASQMNGKILNYSKIARDVGVDVTTVQNYYEILEDTLVGFRLDAYHGSLRKRQVKSPKFYLFDLGVKRALDRTLNIPLEPQTYAFGNAFEHFIIGEILRLNHYLRKDFALSFLNTKDGLEVDLVIERPGRPLALVEIKSKSHVDEFDLRSLRRIYEDVSGSEAYLLSLDPDPKKIFDINVFPWDQGLREIFI